MADDNKLSGKVGLDTTDFKTNVQGMNRELRVLESGFRASAASLGDWANDATGLELRINSLNEQLDIQKQKVAATRAEYERVKEEKGENSRAAQDLEIKLNKETETLGKMENELGDTEAALQEMKEGTDEAGESADEAGNKFEGFKNVLGGIGTVVKGALTVVAALAVAVAAATTAIGGLVFSSAEAAGELVDLSTQTGISTTRLQELSFIGNQVGVSLDTITGAQTRLIRTMDAAKNTNSDQAKAFDTLGVKATDAAGNLRDSEAVFNQVIDALGRIQNPAERDALAMEIFGKSARELNGLILTGSAGMAEYTQQAHEMGAVMEEEDVAALESFGDALAAMQDGLKGTLGTLATAFLPGFQTNFGQLGEYVKEFADIVRGADGDVGKIAEGLGGLIQRIATDVAAQAPQLLEVGLSIVVSILNAIIAALPTLLQAGVEILLTLVNTIIENLPMLIDAALQAVIALANGLAAALPELIPAVVEAMITIVTTLTDNIPLLIQAALQLIQGLAEGLIIALPVLIAAIPVLIDAVLNALIASLPMFFEMAGQIVGTLATGLVAAIPVLLGAVAELIVRLGNTLATFIQTLPSVGRRFIDGLVEGIRNGAGLLYDAVASIVRNMISTITAGLGISSPSKVGIGIGKNLINSIGMGGQSELLSVERFFAGATRQMAMAASTGNSGPTYNNSSSAQNDSFQFFAPVIVQGEMTPGTFGGALKGKRF